MSEQGVLFDLSDITRDEWVAHVGIILARGTSEAERIAHWCAFFPRVVVALPDGWGNPLLPSTYEGMRQFEQFEPIKDAFDEAVRLARTIAPAIEIEFDLDAVTVGEWAAHQDAIQITPRASYQDIIAHWDEFLPKLVTRWPEGWADTTGVVNCGALKQFTQFDPVLQALTEAVSNARKKANKTPIKVR